MYKQLIGQQAVCRYSLTCSNYAISSLEKHGVVKGMALALKRLLLCSALGSALEKSSIKNTMKTNYLKLKINV